MNKTSKKLVFTIMSLILCISIIVSSAGLSMANTNNEPYIEISSVGNVSPAETIQIYLTANNFDYEHIGKGGYQFMLDIPDIFSIKSVKLDGRILTAPKTAKKEIEYNILNGNILVLANTLNYTSKDSLASRAVWEITLTVSAYAANGDYAITYLDSSKVVNKDLEELDINVSGGTITVVTASDTVMGDVNKDGIVSDDDITALESYLSGEGSIDVLAADLKHDGVVDEADLEKLEEYVNSVTVYVDSSKETDIEAKTYSSLDEALFYVPNGGNINVIGTYTAVDGEFVWNAHSKTVNLTGGKLDFSAINELNIRDNVNFVDTDMILHIGGTVNCCGNIVNIPQDIIDEYVVSVVSGEYVPEFTSQYTSWNGPADYKIVYADGNAYNKIVAEYLKEHFETEYGVILEVVTDAVVAQEKEILVGDTNRFTTVLAENRFAVTVNGDKLIFQGGHRVMVEKAAKWFMTLETIEGKVALLTGSATDFASTLSGELAGYTYVWGDEFDGNFLDESKIRKNYHMGKTEGLAVLADNDKIFGVENGVMRMSAIPYSDPSNSTVKFATSIPVCTDETMWWQYGYAEMRVKIPFVHGAWPAWWATNYCNSNKSTATSNGWEYMTEIDMFEVFGENREISTTMHKWFNSNNIIWNQSMCNKGYDQIVNQGKTNVLSASPENKYEYHTVAFKWTPDEMTMYFDGVEYYNLDMNGSFAEGIIESFADSTSMSGFNTPVHMILDNWIYLDSNEPYDGYAIEAAKDLPIELCVDYIRLYQNTDINGTYLNNKGIK